MSRVAGLRRARLDGRAVVLATGPNQEWVLEAPLSQLLSAGADELHAAVDAGATRAPIGLEALPPLDEQEVWASGVTYERSRAARVAESASSDVYQRVYDAARPELFFKAAAWRVPPPGTPLRLRSDSTWDVPEPELALVVTASGDVVGYLVANDMSSRSIERENPLYLPQAKSFDDAIGLSDVIVLARDIANPYALTVRLTITRRSVEVFGGETSTASLHRTFEELRDHLMRELSFPAGVVLLTGTGLVPPDDFTLEDGDEVQIAIDQIGVLRHRVYRSTGRVPMTAGS